MTSVARKASHVSWLGYTKKQARLLDHIDSVGNNGWARNGQSDELMPRLLTRAEEVGLTLAQVKEAMRFIGYHRDNLDMLDRWESKRTTGTFDL